MVAREQHDVLDPVSAEDLHRVLGAFARLVGHADDTNGLAAGRHHHRALSARGQLRRRALHLRSGQAALLNQAVASDHDHARGELPLRAEPRERFYAIDSRQRDAVGRRALDDGTADWMFGVAFERCREREDFGRLRAIERHDVGHPQTAPGQRAGLVERHTAHHAGALEMEPAFDQHSISRRGRNRRHDGHRR